MTDQSYTSRAASPLHDVSHWDGLRHFFSGLASKLFSTTARTATAPAAPMLLTRPVPGTATPNGTTPAAERPAGLPQVKRSLGRKPEQIGGWTVYDSYPRMFASAFTDTRPVMIAARDADPLMAQIGWLRAMGLQIFTSGRLEHATRELARNRTKWSVLIVDLDGFGLSEGGTAADSLHDLRARMPEIVVIGVSTTVANNDFSTDRLALCDVTLRGPVSLAALELGMNEAAMNNLVWQSRRAADKLSALTEMEAAHG
jgi:hypothetical protein